MPFLAIPGVLAATIGGGLSAAGGIASAALSNRSSNRTSTSTQNSNTRTSGSRTRRLRPEQEALLAPTAGLAYRNLTNPEARVKGLLETGLNDVNQAYRGVPDLLRTKYTPGGGGQSGKFGRAAREAELGRFAMLDKIRAQVAALTLDQEQQGANLATSLLSLPFGEDYTQDSQSQGESTGVAPTSSPWASGINNGLETLTTLATIQQLMQGQNRPRPGNNGLV